MWGPQKRRDAEVRAESFTPAAWGSEEIVTNDIKLFSSSDRDKLRPREGGFCLPPRPLDARTSRYKGLRRFALPHFIAPSPCVIKSSFNHFQLGPCNEQKNPDCDRKRHSMCNTDTAPFTITWSFTNHEKNPQSHMNTNESHECVPTEFAWWGRVIRCFSKRPSVWPKLTKTGSCFICGLGLQKVALLAREPRSVHSRFFGEQRPDFLWGVIAAHHEWCWGVGQRGLPCP